MNSIALYSKPILVDAYHQLPATSLIELTIRSSQYPLSSDPSRAAFITWELLRHVQLTLACLICKQNIDQHLRGGSGLVGNPTVGVAKA